MHHFAYRDGVLHAEAVNLAALAAAGRHAVLLLFDRHAERHYRVFADAFADVPSLVCYAMKANSNQAVIATLARLGAGADVVSGGEFKRARAAGVPPTRSCSPASARPRPNSRRRSTTASSASMSKSEPELELLSAIAAAKGRTARVSVRVNPDVDAKTHAKIATGKSENKFGIPISRAREVYARAAKLPGLRVAGVDMHIGSQITDLAPFDDAFALLSDFVRTLRADGHAIEHVDLGGGLGIPYREDNEPPPRSRRLCGVVKRATRGLDCRLIFEPGRLIVGNAGILVTRVLYREARRGQELRRRRRGDERSHPSDALRGPSRHPAGARSRPPARAGSSPTWSDRSAKPGDYLALDRDMPARGRAICWPS